ncbi:HEXXH motif domain-containing protein [Actinoplanes derwentensis]|uniref:HEXXH motif-containing protein n=1 Tax=Actinoplanes derwentensis TaxID=113562 RepID=A0A1H1WZK0_9ACTN|nr:HEXXH motif domain-containing protein [Actinoplanes derwentensis]GID85777.1 HEXXH motif domain-containing protein [Actinoplanes derwentensis]SDT02241.1 HEXXH motif-containing protein [Actinoplanes derwentensis]
MISLLHLTTAAFDRLATGDGGPAAIGELQRAQVSKHLLLIRYLLEQFPDGGAELAGLLERARTADPHRFARVVGDPLVGGWTAIACRAATRGVLAGTDRDHLAAITIVAAAAAGIDATLDIPVHGGLAVLPGWGAVEAGAAATMPVTAASGRLITAGPVLPLRTLTAEAAGVPVRLTLDDLHPYRHGYEDPPLNRLAEADVAVWRDLFARAWELLAGHLPERAVEMTAGLRTLVPLAQLDARSARSATLRHAFGVFGLTVPPTPHDFAVTLVHEFQHSKLSALLDLAVLTDPADDRRYFAPWRTDPRPLPGLLQGVYAFVGVADTWRALRGTVDVATARFAEARLQVDRGLTAIEESGSLTADGERFAAGLRQTADRLLATVLPAAADDAARARLARTFALWREHNRV